MYDRLRSLREDKDLTQKEIGKYLHMSRTGYNQYETVKNDISTKILIELALFYDTSTDYILGLTSNPKAYPRDDSIELNSKKKQLLKNF